MALLAPTDRKDLLREKLNQLIREDPELLKMSAVETSEALIGSAFAFRDYNGGAEDSRHAAQALHQLVDKELAARLGDGR